jgi:hypothetical protein
MVPQVVTNDGCDGSRVRPSSQLRHDTKHALVMARAPSPAEPTPRRQAQCLPPRRVDHAAVSGIGIGRGLFSAHPIAICAAIMTRFPQVSQPIFFRTPTPEREMCYSPSEANRPVVAAYRKEEVDNLVVISRRLSTQRERESMFAGGRPADNQGHACIDRMWLFLRDGRTLERRGFDRFGVLELL